jgi:DNA processing protein
MTAGLDERAACAALAALPALSPRALQRMLVHHTAVDAWHRLRTGSALAPGAAEGFLATTAGHLAEQASSVDPDAVMAACAAAGAQVLVPGDPDFPGLLAGDREPPPVLFVRGDLDKLGHRRVGIVGTRNATAAGRATAFELGESLAASGVAVVSGLARGIDGAAHQGVRAARGAAIAVVGSGIDVPYPRQHRELWEWVATDGLLVSEWPPGIAAEAWHFPLRNRILAALSEVLVVVESRERGGSLITARCAADRGITVMAVPGSPRSRAAAGTNHLLSHDRALIVTAVDDVLVALGLDTSRMRGQLPLGQRGPAARRRAPHGAATIEGRVFALCADRPCTLDDLVTALEVTVHDAAMAAARLERDGWLVDTAGWLEPAGSKLGLS